jgi:lysophospholipase L1-like esterase
MKLLVTLILTATLIPGNGNMDSTQTNRSPCTYLALGDSYTIGESVPAEESFPYQLAAELSKARYPVSQPEIIATTGWTTNELINAVSNDKKDKKYDIVTLLIGVNNQYRGYNQETYRTEFIQLLNTAIAHANGSKNHVFVLSIPDWGVTPFADGRDRSQIAREIDQFNAINKQETQKASVAYVDITSISKQAADDPSLNAEDGLHPSAKMYGLWVRELLPVVEKSLK